MQLTVRKQQRVPEKHLTYQTTNRIFARTNLQVLYVSVTESYLQIKNEHITQN